MTDLLRRTTLRIGAVGIAAVGVGGTEALDFATAQSNRVTPDSLMVAALEYTGNTIDEYGQFTGGGATMQNVRTLHLERHTFQVSGPCHPVYTAGENWINQASFDRQNMQGNEVITCSYGGSRGGKQFEAHKGLCNLPQQVNCKDMNFEPELQIDKRAVGEYVGLNANATGNVTKLVVNVVQARVTKGSPYADSGDIQGHAALYFAKSLGTGRHIREVTLTTDAKGKEATKRVWYR